MFDVNTVPASEVAESEIVETVLGAVEIDSTPIEVDNKKVYQWGNLTDLTMLEIINSGKTHFTKGWFLEQFALPSDFDDLTVKEARKIELDFVNYFYHGVRDVMLKKHCIMIDCDPVVKEAFKVIPAHEQARHASKKATRKAKAALSKGIAGVMNIDETKLDETKLKDTIEQRTRFTRLASSFRKAAREFKDVGIMTATAKASTKPNFGQGVVAEVAS